MSSAGKWNSKRHIDYIIAKKSFHCGKCNTLVSLAAGVDYYYFGNGISIQEGTSTKVNDLEKTVAFIYGNASPIPFSKYFNNDFVVWKCEKCSAININDVLDSIPKSIVPVSSEFSDIKEISRIQDLDLVKLIEEFYKAKSLGFNSSATLLGRKILMHICVEQQIAKEGQKFTEYVDALKKSDLIGAKWKDKVDKLRTLGNDEAHKIKIASSDELNMISSIIKNLFTSIYID